MKGRTGLAALFLDSMRWLFRNLSALLLSLALAVTIWVVAVNEEDPFEERPFPAPLPVVIVGQPAGTMLVGNPRPTATLQLRAPASVWAALTANDIRITADLSAASSGVNTVPLTVEINRRNVQIISLSPTAIELTIEQIIAREIPVRLEINGNPATGFTAKDAALSLQTVTVSGPASAVNSVGEMIARIDLSGARETITKAVDLIPLNAAGQPVAGLDYSPHTVTVTIPVEQLGGYRDVAVKAVITGQVAPGYRITNLSVSPPIVTLFSSNPNQVAGLAGFVETEIIDIADAKDDIEQRVTLVLPQGVSPVGEQTVLVQVSIAAIESSLTIQHDLEIQGLGPELAAFPSLTSVDVILSGPLSTLDTLTPDSIRVVLDLLDLPPGLHRLTPKVVVLLDEVTVQAVLPSTIEVLIIGPGTPSPTPAVALTFTPAPVTPTPTPTRAPSVTPALTFTPQPTATP